MASSGGDMTNKASCQTAKRKSVTLGLDGVGENTKADKEANKGRGIIQTLLISSNTFGDFVSMKMPHPSRSRSGVEKKPGKAKIAPFSFFRTYEKRFTSTQTTQTKRSSEIRTETKGKWWEEKSVETGSFDDETSVSENRVASGTQCSRMFTALEMRSTSESVAAVTAGENNRTETPPAIARGPPVRAGTFDDETSVSENRVASGTECSDFSGRLTALEMRSTSESVAAATAGENNRTLLLLDEESHTAGPATECEHECTDSEARTTREESKISLLSEDMRQLLGAYTRIDEKPENLLSQTKHTENWLKAESPDVKEAFKRAFSLNDMLYHPTSFKWQPDEAVYVKKSISLEAAFKEKEKELSRVTQEAGILKQKLTRARQAEKQIAKTRPSAREDAVKTVYSYMVRKNKDLRVDNSGGSTYGEIRQKGIQDICDTMKELKIITDDKKCVVADLGAGFMLPCLHIAQEFSTCSVVGIENDPVRCLGFASSFEKLLEDDSQPLVNYKIVLIHRDLFSIHDFEFVDVVYAFDEAFPSELNRHIYTVFGKSKRPKWLIVFKVGLPGMREEIKELETLAGVEFVKKIPKLHKSVSGGNSTVCFFQRKIPVTPATTGLCPQFQLQPSWHDDKQALLSAVQSLHRSLVNSLPSGKRNRRTVKRRRVVFLAVE
jgi:hypothetical protein